MTNETAIYLLNNLRAFAEEDDDPAIDTAIEALSADGDLISRQDALKPFCITSDGTRIPEVDCDNFPVEFSVKFIKRHLLSLPSAETHGDLISRQAAVESMANAIWHYPNDLYKNLNSYEMAKGLAEDGLMILPSAEAVQGWIPCSERLPKEKERVLTYDNTGHIDFGRYDKGLWYWEAEACAEYWMRTDSIIAWMPLPKPYKGGDTECG